MRPMYQRALMLAGAVLLSLNGFAGEADKGAESAKAKAPAGTKVTKPAKAGAEPAATSKDAVATVAGGTITMTELEEAAGSRLFQIRTQEYQLKRQLLDEAIAGKLLEKEAAARGISLDELRRVEVEAKVPAVTEQEQKEFYEKNKQRFGQTPEAEALKQIENGLRGQRMREKQVAFVNDLRAKSGVKVFLEPPRIKVEAGENPAKGPADAPVTIVEFSDFQCPYCSRVIPTLQKLQDTYGGKVRIIFRDLPLQMHAQAPKAAEAAACANEQGKFWEMHDKLFASQQKLQIADLKQHAVDLGLTADTFNQCLDSGKFAENVKRDSDDGTRYGLTGTPGFFINGRLLVGAQPYEAFAQVIDEELDFAAAKAPAAQVSKKP
jgi:protein-disulfide isomerase